MVTDMLSIRRSALAGKYGVSLPSLRPGACEPGEFAILKRRSPLVNKAFLPTNGLISSYRHSKYELETTPDRRPEQSLSIL
jgi:hypothetical protein